VKRTLSKGRKKKVLFDETGGKRMYVELSTFVAPYKEKISKDLPPEGEKVDEFPSKKREKKRGKSIIVPREKVRSSGKKRG